jgi:hypothetical protein
MLPNLVTVVLASFFVQNTALAGHWILDPQQVVPVAAAAPPVCNRECIVTFTAGNVAIRRILVKGRDERTDTLSLDGTPVKTPISMGGYTGDLVRSARWDGSVLVITMTTGIDRVGGGDSSGTKTVSRVSRQSDRLVIESTATTNSGTPSSTKYVYVLSK